VIATDCHTPWPESAPPFPVITIRDRRRRAASLGRSPPATR
jgi:hypothetical protein